MSNLRDKARGSCIRKTIKLDAPIQICSNLLFSPFPYMVMSFRINPLTKMLLKWNKTKWRPQRPGEHKHTCWEKRGNTAKFMPCWEGKTTSHSCHHEDCNPHEYSHSITQCTQKTWDWDEDKHSSERCLLLSVFYLKYYIAYFNSFCQCTRLFPLPKNFVNIVILLIII